MSTTIKAFLLEDHIFFAELVEEVMRQKGIEVVHVSNYREAEKVWNQKKDGIKFAILDILLANGRTGVEFYRQVMKSSIPAFFITGCIDETTLNQVKDFKVIQKNDEDLDKILDGLVKEFNNTQNFTNV